jgi:hypothetical protein
MTDFISSLRVHTLREESTDSFGIGLYLLEGCGYEVAWWQISYQEQRSRWRERFSKRREAINHYEDQLRNLCQHEALLALGLNEEKEK